MCQQADLMGRVSQQRSYKCEREGDEAGKGIRFPSAGFSPLCMFECVCMCVCACLESKKNKATNVKPKQTKGKINARVPSTILLPEKTVI